MLRKLLVIVALLVPLALVACGDDEEETTAAPTESAAETTAADETASGSGESIAISETDFALDPADPTTAAGDVTFEVRNDGEFPHNLEVEGNGVEEVTDTIDPGGSDSLTVSLEPGSYEIYCSIGDHAEQGMTGELTVE